MLYWSRANAEKKMNSMVKFGALLIRWIPLLVASKRSGQWLRSIHVMAAARRARVDLNLDHYDAAELSGRSILLETNSESALGREAVETLQARWSSRAEAACLLGSALDSGDVGSEGRRLIELHLATTCGRIARDACLVAASARHARAYEAGFGLYTPSELRALLRNVGRLQRLLGSGRARELWEAAAEALGCREELFDMISSDDEYLSSEETHKRRRRPQLQAKTLTRRADMSKLVIERATALRSRRAVDADARLLRRRAREKLAARVVALGVVTYAAAKLRVVVNNAGGARRLGRDLLTTCAEIAERRLVVPMKNIKNDLLLNKKGNALSDPNALDEAERTLERMLKEWLDDVRQGRSMSREERKQRAKELDMSTVNDVFAEEVRSAVKNLLGGNIARALLIQVQFIYREMYRAMSSIDDILAQNQATIQLLALFPAIFLAAASLRLIKDAFIALSSESVQSTARVQGHLSAIVADAMRIVLIVPQPSAHLPDEHFGALALHVYTLQGRLRKEHARFDPNRLARLNRSLRDLLIPNLSASQLKDLITQIIWEHDFLRLDDASFVPRPSHILHSSQLYSEHVRTGETPAASSC